MKNIVSSNFKFLIVVLTFSFLVLTFISGCAPTYPKEKLTEGIVDLCKREYNVTVDTKIVGATVAVYLPVENLFDAVLNLDKKASKKLNDVILGISRVVLSTDAKLDFYIVITQDPKVPEVEIVYIRYVNDTKKFLYSGISRNEYAKRAVIALKTPPQAERERVLKELFAKLNIEHADEMVKEYMEAEGGVSGIGDISYWNNKFFIKEITLSEFLASQIDERIKMAFREDKDLNKWYELKASEGRFMEAEGGVFMFNIKMADRVPPLYLDTGLELDAQKKRALIFKKIFDTIGQVLHAYKFNAFRRVEVSIPTEKQIRTKEGL